MVSAASVAEEVAGDQGGEEAYADDYGSHDEDVGGGDMDGVGIDRELRRVIGTELDESEILLQQRQQHAEDYADGTAYGGEHHAQPSWECFSA